MVAKHSSLERQQAIKELISKSAISDQKQLVELLRKHYKIETNQTVISRDLRKLGVIKRVVKDVSLYEVPEIDVRAEILRLALIDVTYNESMIVITTYPGLADFVGDCLDKCRDLGILGCLAGENVVFAVPVSIKKIDKICLSICDRFHFKKIDRGF